MNGQPVASGSTLFTATESNSVMEVGTRLKDRNFITSTYAAFLGLQSIPTSQLNPSVVQRVFELYQRSLLDHLIELQSQTNSSEQQEELSHYAGLHSILSLTSILYLDETGEGIVGEVLLHWVNQVDPAPSSADMIEVSELERSWESGLYFPTINRCVLRGQIDAAITFLSNLFHHPSKFVQSLSQILSSLLESFPRTSQFNTDREFIARWRQWRSIVVQAKEKMQEIYENGSDDDVLGEDQFAREDFEAAFQVLYSFVAGEEEIILTECDDWREAIGAWGIWINPTGTREDLVDTMTVILKQKSVDSTILQDSIQSHLLLGDVARALQKSSDLSSWLVCHLADALEKVKVLEVNANASISLRDRFVLQYSEFLFSDTSFWKINVAYLSSLSNTTEARSKMRKILLSVDLKSDSLDQTQAPIVEQVLQVCSSNELDDVGDEICQLYSSSLIEKKQYGTAVAFCVRAEDSTTLARIIELILEEYIVSGQAAFIAHVDSIPTSLLRPESRSSSPMEDLMYGSRVFAHQLAFIARYREFFSLYSKSEMRLAAELLVLLLESGVVPKSFYAVLLLDLVPLLEASESLVTQEEIFDLLRLLEEIAAPIEILNSDRSDYLTPLARILGSGGLPTARAQLDVIRAALASCLGRCIA